MSSNQNNPSVQPDAALIAEAAVKFTNESFGTGVDPILQRGVTTSGLPITVRTSEVLAEMLREAEARGIAAGLEAAAAAQQSDE